MNSVGPGRPKSFTHIEHRAGARGFAALNSSSHSRIFTFVSVGSSPRFYLFISATGRIGVHTAPKCGTKRIRYVMLHFRDRRDAASLRHRNRAASNVVTCELDALSGMNFVVARKLSGMVNSLSSAK